MREPRLRSSPSIFHPSTNRRMYRFASNGEMGEPCGMPRRLSRASVVRVFLPRSSVSSTGHSSHILIRCSTRRSTIRRVTDCVEDVPGDPTRLAENFCGLLGIAACFVAKALASRIDLKATLHDHRPGNEDIMRRGDRTVTLVGAKIRKFSTECLTPKNRIASIAGMTEIERVRHLRYKAANQLRIAPETAAREDQNLAADALAYSVARHNL